jgi:acetyl esterase/lipase
VRWRDILADCALATAWAHRNAAALGADPRRIHLMGHSAGAYNAAMLALDARWLARHGLAPRQLAGWIGIAGPYDFLPIGDRNTRVAFDWPDTPPESQPIGHVAAGAPRALLLAPQFDGTVDPRRNTVQLGERLRAVGVAAKTRLYEGVSHVTIVGALATPLSFLAPVRGEVAAFCGGKAAV